MDGRGEATGRVEGIGTGTMCHCLPNYLPTYLAL